MQLDMLEIQEMAQSLSPEGFDAYIRKHIQDGIYEDWVDDGARGIEIDFDKNLYMKLTSEHLQNFADRIVLMAISDKDGSFEKAIDIMALLYVLDPTRDGTVKQKTQLSPFMFHLFIHMGASGILFSMNDPMKNHTWELWMDKFNRLMQAMKAVERLHKLDPIMYLTSYLLGEDYPEIPTINLGDERRTLSEWIENGYTEITIDGIRCENGTDGCTCIPVYWDIEKERFTQFTIAGTFQPSSICDKCQNKFVGDEQVVDNLGAGMWTSVNNEVEA